MQDIKNPRRFSLEDDFMKSRCDDLVYGFMRSISTSREATKAELKEHPKVKRIEYLTFEKFQQEKKVIQQICGCSPKTITNRVDKLIDCGLVEVSAHKVIDQNGEEHNYECYVFPFDYDGIYKVISQEMVGYLVATRNSQAIRIYLYLLNCSTHKEDYTFTIKEIKKALGYAETTKTADKVIRMVLDSFQKEGVINFENEWQTMINSNGKQTQTERMVLKFIATDTDQF